MTESVSQPALPVARSVERALALLDAVVTAQSSSLSDAARAVDIPPSTALRHLRALQADGYLERDANGDFRAGPHLVRLALLTLEAAPTARLAQLAQPHLDTLMASTGESAYLAVREGNSAVYLAQAESTRAIRHVSWLGKSIPLVGTAVGAALRGEVRRGVATVMTGGVEPDVCAVATPVRDQANKVVAAIAVLGPAARLRGPALDAARGAVTSAAGAIEAGLGTLSGSVAS